MQRLNALLTKLKQDDYRWIVTPIIVFVITRGLLFIVAYIARVGFLKLAGNLPWHAAPNNLFLDIWNRWDSDFYRSIATQGYTFSVSQHSTAAFFPMYPLLIGLVNLVVDNSTLAGILVSNICLLGALIFLYRLTLLEFSDHPTAQRTIYYIALFPTAVFLGAVYPESTFLFFSIATVYFARRRMWLWAGFFGALATASRFIGIALYGVVLLEWLRAHSWTLSTIFRKEAWSNLWQGVRQDWRGLVLVQLVPLGLVGYILFLSIRFGNPYAFFNAQATWGRDSLVNPLVPIWRDFSAIFRQAFLKGDKYMWIVQFDALVSVLGIVMTPFIWRKLGEGLALYTLLSVLVPTATGNTQSMARFAAVVFPAFMLLGVWGRNSVLDKVITIGFTLLLGVFATAFVNGLFIG